MSCRVRDLTSAILFAAVALLLGVRPAAGYSVLTHEAIIDSVWQGPFQRALRQRFPHITAEQLRSAHAYAYGGCLIQDAGYYPFGSRLFSDLTHYVRSGDFVETLLREARDPNEYAFALGALEHYAADDIGHPIGVNRSVALLYPKLSAKFGKEVTFADNPVAHLKTEFGFDVLQVARGRYAPDAYRDFIGFQIATPLLERGFRKTYSLELRDVFGSLDLALGTYRYTVGTIIPKITRVAWAIKADEIESLSPGVTRQGFVFTFSRADFEKQWGREYQRPGPFSKVVALVMRVVPKVGPLRALAFKTPTPEAERLFLVSFQGATERYRELLEGARRGPLELKNDNLDTGRPARSGEYLPADKAYSKLLKKTARRND